MKITKDSKVGFDSTSLLVDGKRWFPVMGEMHFSRCPKGKWEEELCKMKAGGVDIVSLYVIWIHHEEIKGEFDFTGDRCLKDFLETVKKCGLYAILRIGPWAHGEARNGGFPDWLLEDSKENGYETRTDAPRYLEHVKAFYEKTYEQAKGYFLSDNGPVIGIQIENEYGHCGGKTGEEGEQHMRTLLSMAKEIGFVTPIYTATGWGGAVTGGMLPVMGGYCEAPWDQRLTEIEPSGNYIFTRERNDHNIGSDHGLGAGITFDMDKFPYLTAELGGGLQVTHHRRPIASGLDTAAMTMTKLGSGANLLGYYMYHGGTNPKGKLTTLQETRATGYPNDLPEYSYDFNAPLREFGQMEDTYREVRLIASFVHDFGSELCDMPYTEQPGNPLKPDNLTDLRTAVRHKKIKLSDGSEVDSGYLFVNNYQRRYEMASHKNVELKAYAEDGKSVIASFPARDIENGDFFFYPFNLPIGERAALTIDATPVCILDNADKKTYVFYSENSAETYVECKGDPSGNTILVMTREEALHSGKVLIDGKEYLIVSEAEPVTNADGKVELKFTTDSEKPLVFRTFPALDKTPNGFVRTKSAGEAAEFIYSNALASYESENVYCVDGKVSVKEIETVSDAEPGADKNVSYEDSVSNKSGCAVDDVYSTCKSGTKRYEISVSGINSDANETYLHIDYVGDIARLYSNGEILTDSFYTGQEWEIGLSRYCGEEFKGEIVITPLTEDDKEKMYLQEWPDMPSGVACGINGVRVYTQFSILIS